MNDYYILVRSNNDNYPLLEWDQNSGMFRKWKPVTISDPINLRLGEPVPANPEMVDYHSLPKPVVSEKIKNILDPMEIYGIQPLPAKVKVNNDELDYWFVHIFNKIACLDMAKSIYKTTKNSGRVIDITHLVLNEDVLEEIPLENRLVFVLSEYTAVYLYHETVKDAIMSVNPVGLRFFRVDEWSTDIAFA